MNYELTVKIVINNLVLKSILLSRFQGLIFVNDSLVHFPWIYFYKFKKIVCALLYFANIAFHIKKNLKLFLKNFMVPFYGWGSTTQLQSHYEKTVYFFTITFPEIPDTHSKSCVKDTKNWFNEFMCNMTVILNWLLVLCDSDCS